MGGTSLAYSTAPAIVQDIVPNRMRGKAVAVYMLLTGLSGYALGPTAVAMLTDHVFKSDAALPYSLIICLAPAALIASILAWVGLKPYLKLRMKLIGSLTASESAHEPQRISAT
jgi:MFS family permease